MLRLEKVEYKRLQMSDSKEKCSSLKQFKGKNRFTNWNDPHLKGNYSTYTGLFNPSGNFDHASKSAIDCPISKPFKLQIAKTGRFCFLYKTPW